MGFGGYIVRGALTESEQKWLYEELYSMIDVDDDNCEEMRGLRLTRSPAQHRRLNPQNRPQPFVTWVHPYTRRSNVKRRPTKLLTWAEGIGRQLLSTPAADSSSQHHYLEVDSLLTQLYAPGGNLLRHRDEDLSWGVGVSLGAAAVFECFPGKDGTKAGGGQQQYYKKVTIRSGDILVGEFGKMPHAVTVADHSEQQQLPKWWQEVDHFGSKVRCNLLFRKALSAKERVTLAEERSQRLYGMSLDALKKRTGKDEADLSVHLRHLALE